MTSPSPSAWDTTRVSYFQGSGCIGKDTGAQSVKLYWMKSSEAWPGGHWLESDRSCFDEDKPGRKSDSLRDTHVGNVHQIEGDPGGGMWEWRVTARFPGSRFPDPPAAEKSAARMQGRCVVECYERMLTHYNRHRPDG
jgi:hypothetical protein